MSFNRTVKYFKSIRAYVYCDICGEVVGMDINKEDIRNGLQTGLYIYKYKHKNKHADLDDPNDNSWQEHTVAVYIDNKYEVRGIKCYFGDSPLSDKKLEAGTEIPVVEKEIPAMSVHLGMISPDEYRILQLCDGNNTLKDVAEISGMKMEDLRAMMNKLKEKGLISLIKRA
ncbi:MAG: winged helix-turn-helix domain-containing protein [Promethearchaeota archaeon]